MYLICNHKNRLKYDEIRDYSQNLRKINTKKVDLIVAPSLPYIYNFIDYTLAAQDISAYEDEIVTGDITGKQLESMLIKYVIIGHPERRKYYYETIDVLKNKIENANKNNIKVIYCFTDYGKDIEESKISIKNEYNSIKDILKANALIAYEPLWAIGNSQNINFNYIEEIIKYLSDLFNKEILYGGSVDDKNIEKLMKIEKVGGFLISNSSLNINVLQNIIDKIT